MNSETERARILIIDDDAVVAAALQRLLEQDYEVETLDSAEEGLRRIAQANFDVVVTDLQMRGKSGFELIKNLHVEKPHLPVILLTGHHTTDHAIEASKLGAFDYVVKPIVSEQEIRDFLGLIAKAITTRSTAAELDREGGREPPAHTMVGRSRPMQQVYKDIGRVAGLPVVVLIRGETGTGKELVARAIHRYSDRADQPFVIVNCVAIPEALLESELFGHEQGAFTGAQTMRVGKFEQADQGTIFLDEIGDMSLATQAKLLRVLQESSIRRIGGRELIGVDVRVLAATHRDLEGAVGERTFREDLYYRLNDASIRLPSLRERREDIRPLVQHFLHMQRGRPGTQPTISTDALRILQYHSWPGNVRELKNVVQQATVMARGYSINPEIVRTALEQANLSQREPSQFLDSYVAELLETAVRDGRANIQDSLTEWVERELYSQALALAGDDQSQVARWLGVSRPTVRERLLHYGLHPSGQRV